MDFVLSVAATTTVALSSGFTSTTSAGFVAAGAGSAGFYVDKAGLVLVTTAGFFALSPASFGASAGFSGVLAGSSST